MNINEVIEQSALKNLKDAVEYYETGNSTKQNVLNTCVAYDDTSQDCHVHSEKMIGYEIYLEETNVYIYIHESIRIMTEGEVQVRFKFIEPNECTEEWYFSFCLSENVRISLENFKYLMEISKIYRRVRNK